MGKSLPNDADGPYGPGTGTQGSTTNSGQGSTG